MRFIGILSLTLLSALSFGFNPSPIGGEQGLPSQTVYFTMEDDRGFIWLATDRGVCRYNGLSIEIFTVEDGLIDNEIFTIYQDSKQRIWFGSFNGQLCYFQNEKFHTSKNSKLPRLQNSSYIKAIVEDPEGNMFFQTFQDGFFVMNTQFETRHFLPGVQIFQVFQRGGWVSMVIPNGKYGSTLLQLKDAKHITTPDTIAHFDRTFHINTGLINDKFWLFFDGQNWDNDSILQFRDGQLIPHPLPINTKQVYFQEEEDNILYIGTIDGLYTLDAATFELLSHELSGMQVVHRYKTGSGTVYYSTLQHGAFRVQQKSRMEYVVNQPVVSMCKEKNGPHIWIGARDYIYRLNHYTGVIDTFRLPARFGKNNTIYNIEELGQDSLHVSSGRFGLMFLKGHFFDRYRHSGVRDIMVINDKYYLAKGTGLFVETREELFSPDHRLVLKDAAIRNKWSKAVVFYNGAVVLGSNSGLSKLDDTTVTSIYPDIRSRITTLATHDKLLAVGTASEGLYMIRNGRIEHHIHRGLSSVNDVLFLSDEKLLIANDHGIFELNLSTANDESPRLTLRFPIRSGNTLLRVKNMLYIGGLRGVVKQSLEESYDSEKPALYISSIRVNGKKSSLEKLKDLRHLENQLQISLIPVSFIPEGNVMFEYRINDGEWLPLQSAELSLGPLEPANYTLFLRCTNFIRTSDVLAVEVRIKPAWHQRIEVRLAGGALILALLLLGFVLYNQSSKRKAQQVLEISELRQKALRAQINPHFLFNVLNSVQNFFLKDRPYDGQVYLGKFAQLMRSILNHSDETFVSLQEEITRIKLYVELEQIRVDNSFDFQISLDPQIDPYHLNFPSMIIQPFIENAIWHGLKGGENLIELKFEVHDKNMAVIVHDNGVGIDPNQLKNSDSKGIRLIRDRVNSLNSMYKTHIDLEIENDNGTTVTLTIPLFILQ